MLRFPTPREIDLAALEESTQAGGHTVVSADLEATGRVTEDRCATCDQERPFLVIEETGQRFEIEGLSGEEASSEASRFRGTLSMSSPEHPRFAIESPGSD